MATPMTPAQSKAAFLAEGLRVVEIPGYQTNDRAPITGRPAGPKHGLVNHHTGGDTSNPYAYAAGILSKGSSALVGPLCHEGLDPDTGTLYMVGTGRTNHAGGGDPAVLAAVKADAVPYDRELKPTKGNVDGVDGNGPFYGLEVMYSGARDVPRVGYVAMVKWNVARCRFHGWTGASAIAHREWSDDKPDPGRVSLPQLRRDVDAALALPPGAWGSTVTPPPPQEDDMPLTNEDIQKVADKVWDTFIPAGTSGDSAKSLLGQANQQDWYQTNTLKTLVDTLAKVTSDPNVSAENVEKWIKDGIAESVKVTGTLTVEPASAPEAAPDAAPAALQDAAPPACADGDDPNNA